MLLTGPTGIGKSTLARTVASAREGTVVEVLALAELRDVPFGAFAPVLASPDLAPELSDRLRDVVGAVVALGPSLLLVDDAPLLDELSAAAVYQLIRVHKVPSILTARDEHPLTGAIQRLDHENVLERVAVGPLGAREVEAVLEERFGTRVEPESVRGMLARSEGNPLMLRTLALAAEEQDTIQRGSRGAIVDAPRLPRHVSAIVAERLAGLGVTQREQALFLAAAQPLPLRLAESHVDTVLGTGLVELTGAPGREQVSLVHPLIAEVLLADASPALRNRVADEASGLLIDSGDEQLAFRGLLLRLRHGLPVVGERLAWAASYAHVVQDHVLAARLARLSLEQGGRFDARLTLGSALSALGDDAALTSIEDALADADGDDETALALARLGHHLAIRLGRASDAVTIVSRTLERIASPAARALVSADLLKWKSMAGTALEAELVDPEPGPAELAALIGRAMVASMLGHTAATRAATAAARPLVPRYRSELPTASDLLDLNDFLATVFDGRLLEAEAFARARLDGPRTDAAGLWSYTMGLIALHTGRMSEARQFASAAVTELEWRDFTGLLGAATALHATAEVQNGAHVDLGQHDSSDVKVLLQTAEARAWSLALDGDRALAAAVLREAAEAGIEAGHPALASLTAATACRFGEGRIVAEVLDAIDSMTGSRLVSVLAMLARAQASAQASGLAASAQELSDVGMTVLAMDAFTDAARLESSREIRRRWLNAAERLRGHADLFSLAPTRASGEQLTEREREVARAAASRRRSQEIADELGISIRTVDNHLARAYRKLGVRGRLELAEALERLPE